MLIESAIFIHFLILHHLCTKVGNYLDQIWKRLVTSQRRVCLPRWWGRYYGKNRIRPHIVAHGLHLNQHFCLSWCLFEFYNVSNAKNANTTNTGWPRPYFSISNHKYWEMVHFFWIVATLNWFFKLFLILHLAHPTSKICNLLHDIFKDFLISDNMILESWENDS